MGVGYLTGQSGGGSNIKSIQRGNLSLTTETTEQMLAVGGFDRNKSIIRASVYIPGTQPALSESLIAFYISNSADQVWYKKTRAASMNVSWELIEYNNVKSKQTGLINNSSSILTIPIASINQQKSIVVMSSYSVYDVAQYLDRLQIRYWFDGDNLKIEQKANVDRTIFWQVLEFK